MTVQTKNFDQTLASFQTPAETRPVEVRAVEIHLQSACEFPWPFDAVQALANFNAKTELDPDGTEVPLGVFVKAFNVATDPSPHGCAPVELTLGVCCCSSEEDVPNARVCQKGLVHWFDAKLAADIEHVAKLAKTFFETALHSKHDTHRVAQNLVANAHDGSRHRFYDWDRPVTERTNIWPDEHGVGLASFVTLRTEHLGSLAFGAPFQLSRKAVASFGAPQLG